MTTITINRATVEQALEALCECGPQQRKAKTALRAALAQQAEPVQRSQDWHAGVLEGHLRERERWLAQQAEPQITHNSECWRWHHKCAVAKIERECKHD